MKTAAFTTIAYGILVGAGGIMGYINKGSQVSLIAGCASGVILIGCGLAMRGNRKSIAQAAWWAALLVTLMLLARFGRTFLATGDWMPAGMVAVLSIFSLIGLFVGRK